MIWMMALWLGSAGFVRADPLSLADCLRQAQALSAQAKSGLIKEARARAAVQEARSGLLPQLSAVGIYQQSNNPEIQVIDNNEAVLRLTQNLSPFSPQWERARQKEADFRAERAMRTANQQDVALEVKRLYFSILRGLDEAARLAEIQARLENMRETMIPKYSVGRLPPFDAVKIRAALSALARRRDFVAAQLDEDKESLALMLGLKNGDSLSLRPLKAAPPALPPTPDARAAAGDNPRLLALQERIAAAESGARAARRERYPDLSAGLDYGYMGNNGLFNLYPSANYPSNVYGSPLGLGYNASLSLSLPLWDWGGISARVAQNERDAALARADAEIESQKLAARLSGLRRRAEAALADESRMTALLTETRRAAEVQTRLYRRGATGVLEAVDAWNIWLDTMITEREDYYEYLLDLARIENALGRESVRYE
ncbi:MAG: TolC family protein [Elusimicrobia bacterium]|nr:TolC family protein [Elusimicrobiota bacterium]